MKITKFGMTTPTSGAGSSSTGGDGGGSDPVTGIGGVPVDTPSGDPTEYLNGEGHWTIPAGVTLSDDTPQADSGAGDPGIDTEASRSDHVHPASAGGLSSISDGVTTVSPASSATVPLGGVTDLGGGDAGLNFIPNRGPIEQLLTVADCGAAYEIDWSVAATFDLTLTEACAFTFANVPSVAGYIAAISVILRGNFASTWPPSVTWKNGIAPTGATQDDLVLVSTDGGTSVGGIVVGTGSVTFGEAADIGVETFGASAAAGTSGKVADAGHVHQMPANPGGQYRAWLYSAAGGDLTILTDADGNPLTGLCDLE